MTATVGMVMNCRDSADTIEATLSSVRGLVDHWTIVDTGSTDGTPEVVTAALSDIAGELHHAEWVGFAHNRTLAVELARGTADWLLWLDDDMTVEFHPDLKTWLGEDPDPDVAAWQVEILGQGLLYRLPLLLRGDLEWRYEGAVHEYLTSDDERKERQLLGLTVTQAFEKRRRDPRHDLELLRPGFYAGDPRDTFYYAETLRGLGRIDEAIAAYGRRAGMGGFEEEAWYAAYQAASLANDVEGLLDVHRRRPWRHEPLTAAARLVAQAGAADDVLFLETCP